MKWVCLVVLIADLLLFAFAGFRYFTVPRKDVDALTSEIDAMVKSGRSGLERMANQALKEGARMEDVEVRFVDEPPAPAEGSSDATDSVKPVYLTDEAAAMNINVLGVSRQSAKLKAIEDGRRLVNEEGAAALDEP
ncbi:MAG: hypothetical protein PWP23_890 [Candidatus Sumerlaeota bacterium]|nr:hypothetical protein [Candidatus Sumerlaeota bacterium]